MKISHQWLDEWVGTGLAVEQLAERLTMAGLEVDGLEAVAPPLDNVVVARIAAVEPHPDADRLSVCRVLAGDSEYSIVCGADNARAGLKTALARVGATLPGGLTIKPAKLRGVASEGMLCSADELGLGDGGEGIMELPDDAPDGQPLTEYLQLDDTILEIDLTPNRGDCLSVRGLAAELAALTEKPVNAVEIEPVPAATDRRVEIELASPENGPRYIGRVIEGVNVAAQTPLWMRERLRRSGIRSLGIIVDVTNYVLLELGQPMHAFDLDNIGQKIIVRLARQDEPLTLLDGQSIKADDDMLMIADEQRPLALAGIMGGQDSAVGDDTRNILLEAAWFNPDVVGGKARRLGLATESSHRFERGVDPQLPRLAMERATRLILELAGGRPGPVAEACNEAFLPVPKAVTMRLSRLNQLLGTALSAAVVNDVFERLGMQVSQHEDVFEVTPPSTRSDIAIEADLIEEVARIHGYNRLPARHPGGEIIVQPPAETRLQEEHLREQLAARGFHEVITWSFVSRKLLSAFAMDDRVQPLANPMSAEMAVLRTSLVPGMVEVAARNLRRQIDSFRLFETGHCFASAKNGFEESLRFGILMTGRSQAEHFSASGQPLDFFDLKGEVENLIEFNAIEGDISFKKTDEPWLHPGQAAELQVDGRAAGWLGQLHPALTEALDLDQAVFVAELSLEAVSARRLPQHHDSGRYPGVRRDIALVVADHHSAASLTESIRETAGTLLEDCVIFDQYRGKGIDTGFRSLAIGLILRDVSRTLRDDEVDVLVERVLDSLKSRFGAKLRG